jgi:hypothetical protein
LYVHKRQVRKALKWQLIAGVEREALVLLKFTPEEARTQLRWKHAGEFEYRGEMYDIVETAIHGDTAYYWLWWDREETQLNRQLQALVGQALRQDPERRAAQARFFDFFETLYCAPQQRFCFVVYGQNLPPGGCCGLGAGVLLHPPPSPPPEYGGCNTEYYSLSSLWCLFCPLVVET